MAVFAITKHIHIKPGDEDQDEVMLNKYQTELAVWNFMKKFTKLPRMKAYMSYLVK